MRTRDSQRSRLYAAETVIHPYGRRFISFGFIGPYVFEVVQRCSHVCPELRDGPIYVQRGRENTSAWARGLDDLISLPRWAWREPTILHELAHIVIYRRDPKRAAHGPEFAGVLLDLVGEMMGVELRARLAASFRKHRVRYGDPILIEKAAAKPPPKA